MEPVVVWHRSIFDQVTQIEDLIDNMVMDNIPECHQVSAGGGLKAKAEAESFEERVQIVMVVDKGFMRQ